MNELLQEVVQLNQVLIKEENAVIEWGNLPVIRAAKTPLLQLLQNLIGNALKYRKTDESPHIKVSFLETITSWQFAVADNGIGIDPQFFDKIFVIFQRLHHRDEFSGTGLGLAICKKIIDGLKGKIWVESVQDQGSTFYFTISKFLGDK